MLLQTRREKHWWSSASARACSSGVSPFGGLGALGSHRPRPHPRHPFLLHAPRPSRSSLVHAPPRSDLSRLGTAPSIQLATNPLHNHIRHKLEHLGDHEVCIEQEVIEALVDVALASGAHNTLLVRRPQVSWYLLWTLWIRKARWVAREGSLQFRLVVGRNTVFHAYMH